MLAQAVKARLHPANSANLEIRVMSENLSEWEGNDPFTAHCGAYKASLWLGDGDCATGFALPQGLSFDWLSGCPKGLF